MSWVQAMSVPMEELIKVVSLQMETAGRASLTVTGCSMLPMLRHQRDTVILAPVTGTLKPGDIALYQRQSGQYVLHRVIYVKEDGYRFCGDNQAQLESVAQSQLVAQVVEYTKDGKLRKLKGVGYGVYRWCCVRLFAVRKYYIALRRRLGRWRRRLFIRRKSS